MPMTLPLARLRPDPDRPRKDFDRYDGGHPLVASLRRFGVLDELTVCESDDGSYLIIDGARRHRAAEALGLSAVPCLVHPPLPEGERHVRRFLMEYTHRPWRKAERAAAQKRLLTLPD